MQLIPLIPAHEAMSNWGQPAQPPPLGYQQGPPMPGYGAPPPAFNPAVRPPGPPMPGLPPIPAPSGAQGGIRPPPMPGAFPPPGAPRPPMMGNLPPPPVGGGVAPPPSMMAPPPAGGLNMPPPSFPPPSTAGPSRAQPPVSQPPPPSSFGAPAPTYAQQPPMGGASSTPMYGAPPPVHQQQPQQHVQPPPVHQPPPAMHQPPPVAQPPMHQPPPVAQPPMHQPPAPQPPAVNQPPPLTQPPMMSQPPAPAPAHGGAAPPPAAYGSAGPSVPQPPSIAQPPVGLPPGNAAVAARNRRYVAPSGIQQPPLPPSGNGPSPPPPQPSSGPSAYPAGGNMPPQQPGFPQPYMNNGYGAPAPAAPQPPPLSGANPPGAQMGVGAPPPTQPGYPNQPPPGFTPAGYNPQSAFNPNAPYGANPQGGFNPNNMRPGAPGAPAPPAKRGIDPDSIPSPVAVQSSDQERYASGEFVTGSRFNPPLSTTKCRISDDGNASPHTMRSTLYAVPNTEELLSSSNIPLCLVLQPLAQPGQSSPPVSSHLSNLTMVPTVDHGPDGPIRCRRCKAYLNPGVLFTDGGRRFQCNFCACVTDVPEPFFCNLDHTGRRHDLAERHELTKGTVEYLAPPSYCARPTQVPGILFAIDVSYNSVQSGMVHVACAAIREVLRNLPRPANARPEEPSPVKIGIVTFDRTIHFYNLTASLSQPQMMVVSDVEDVFLPLSAGLLVNAESSKDVIESLLERIPAMFQNTRETEPQLGAAVKAAYLALENVGGKILLFHSVLPTQGEGKLKNREDAALLGTEKERTLYKPQDAFYEKIAGDCGKQGICVDVFVFPHGYTDVATISPLATLTGGTFHRYPFFRATTQGDKLINEVRYSVCKHQGFDAMLRLRCSTGLRATEYFGAFRMGNTTDVELAGIDQDKAIAVRIRHDDKIPDNADVHFQVALLYTSCFGERRIRVSTLSIRAVSTLSDVFRGADMDALVNVLPKLALKEAQSVAMSALNKKMTQHAVAILACYRKHCTAPNSAPGQLILPECLKLLPLYANTIIRSVPFRAGADLSSDERVFHMITINSMGCAQSMTYFYPRVFPLHELEESLGGEFKMPDVMRPSLARFKESGVYLVENGRAMFLWIGRLASPSWIQQVLGAVSFQNIDPQQNKLPVLANTLSTRVREVMERVQQDYPPYLNLHIVKQKDPNEIPFHHFLVEDKVNDNMSYVDFLCFVHKEIQASS